MAEEFQKEVEEEVGKRLDPEKCEEIEKKIKALLVDKEKYTMDDLKDHIIYILVSKEGYNEQDVLECINKVFDDEEDEEDIDAREKLNKIKKIVNSLKL